MDGRTLLWCLCSPQIHRRKGQFQKICNVITFQVFMQELIGFIHDSCPGCAKYAWDLSNALYLELTSEKDLGEDCQITQHQSQTALIFAHRKKRDICCRDCGMSRYNCLRELEGEDKGRVKPMVGRLPSDQRQEPHQQNEHQRGRRIHLESNGWSRQPSTRWILVLEA